MATSEYSPIRSIGLTLLRTNDQSATLHAIALDYCALQTVTVTYVGDTLINVTDQ